MKFFTVVCGIVLLATSCMVASMESVSKKNVPRPYKKILTMYVRGSFDFFKLDSATYNVALRKRFNDLDNLTIRRGLETTLKNELGSAYTDVSGSSTYFEVNKDITWNEFDTILQSLHADALLLVNEEKQLYTAAGFNTNHNTAQQAASTNFRCYLIDMMDNEPYWLGQSNFYGPLVNYRILTDKIGKELVLGKYIADPYAVVNK